MEQQNQLRERWQQIVERPSEGRGEERTLRADILSDRRVDVAAAQLVRGLFVARRSAAAGATTKT